MLKYTDRLAFVNHYFVTFGYVGLLVAIYFLIQKYKSTINTFKNFNLLGYTSFLLFFAGILFINFKIDGLTLNSDRWSALEIFIQSILKGNYPYAVLDHLDNTTSNLPSLFYIGLPFYLLGDVGYLQAFVFFAIILSVFLAKIDKQQKLFLFLLIILSPAYFWEVFAKSDLLSNTFLVLLFIYIWQQKYGQHVFEKVMFLAFFAMFFALTRGTVVIPLTLFLFHGFVKLKIKNQIKFIFWLLFFGVLISLPILWNLPNLAFIKEHNPFNHQTKYAPTPLILLTILLPFYYAFKVKKNSDVFLYTTYILGGLMLITFILNAFEEGFNANLYNSLFDISYLSIAIPSIFFYFLSKFKEQLS